MRVARGEKSLKFRMSIQERWDLAKVRKAPSREKSREEADAVVRACCHQQGSLYLWAVGDSPSNAATGRSWVSEERGKEHSVSSVT